MNEENTPAQAPNQNEPENGRTRKGNKALSIVAAAASLLFGSHLGLGNRFQSEIEQAREQAKLCEVRHPPPSPGRCVQPLINRTRWQSYPTRESRKSKFSVATCGWSLLPFPPTARSWQPRQVTRPGFGTPRQEPCCRRLKSGGVPRASRLILYYRHHPFSASLAAAAPWSPGGRASPVDSMTCEQEKLWEGSIRPRYHAAASSHPTAN
jgi:hypothetical protein